MWMIKAEKPPIQQINNLPQLCWAELSPLKDQKIGVNLTQICCTYTKLLASGVFHEKVSS